MPVAAAVLSGAAAVQDEAMISSEPLIQSLQQQPLLVVLRPEEPARLAPLLERLQQIGCLHVEIAWGQHPAWSRQCLELVQGFPGLRLGAASLADQRGLEQAIEAGFRYGVSPLFHAGMLEMAHMAGLLLVPGVMTPTEVRRAMSWGCRIVKLFPAACLGPGYWQMLKAPLSPSREHPWPFCIAAGGLAPADVGSWLAAGVDALALGSSLLRRGAPEDGPPEILGGIRVHLGRLERLLRELTPED